MAFAHRPRFSREPSREPLRGARFFMTARGHLATLLFVSVVGPRCTRATSENIQLWKTTEKGPGKLEAALADPAVEPKLRAEAAVALVDIGRADQVDKTFEATPPDARRAIVDSLIPLFTAAAQDSAPEKSLANRDALFSIRSYADPVPAGQIDVFLRGLIEKDLRVGRVRNGRHSVEKILAAAPRPSADMLAELLGQPLEPFAVTAVTELLAKLGDEGEREAGASRLVARARTQHPIPDPVWRSIGLLGGAASRKFLGEEIESGRHEDATAAARALQQRREPAMLGLALQVAANPKADRTVRDEMFGVVETIGGLQARAALLDIIRTDREDVVRYRAFESLLAVAPTDGVLAGLDAFPAGASYKKEDVEDLLVKLIEKVGPAARPQLLKGLDSRSALTRMAAVMTLEQLGTSADEAALGRKSSDSGAPKGFPAGDSVGKEAVVVAGIVRSRK